MFADSAPGKQLRGGDDLVALHHKRPTGNDPVQFPFRIYTYKRSSVLRIMDALHAVFCKNETACSDLDSDRQQRVPVMPCTPVSRMLYSKTPTSSYNFPIVRRVIAAHFSTLQSHRIFYRFHRFSSCRSFCSFCSLLKIKKQRTTRTRRIKRNPQKPM
mgnify:CR=1 FL=1